MVKLSQQVYSLIHEPRKLNDGPNNFDAVLVRPPGRLKEPHIKTISFATKRIQPTYEIKLQGHADALAKTDYPLCAGLDRVASLDMINILYGQSRTPEHTIEVEMHGFEHLNDRELTVDRSSPDTVFDNFCAFQVLRRYDLMDMERSRYRVRDSRSPLNDNEESILYFTKLVLARRTEGYPAFFQLKNASSYLFVSGVAKLALESAGIKGIAFMPVFDGIEHYGKPKAPQIFETSPRLL